MTAPIRSPGFWVATASRRIGRAASFLLLGVLAGACTAAGFGYLVGLPSLRLRGDYLAIVTLGFGEIIRVVLELTKPQLDSKPFP